MMKSHIFARLREVGVLIAGLAVLVHGPSMGNAAAAPAPAGQPPQTNASDGDVSMTRLDICLRADFRSNSVAAVVKGASENASSTWMEHVLEAPNTFWRHSAVDGPGQGG